jgi:hypothetical protein
MTTDLRALMIALHTEDQKAILDALELTDTRVQPRLHVVTGEAAVCGHCGADLPVDSALSAGCDACGGRQEP